MNASFELEQALVATMGDMYGQRRAVMFSGGFDSVLIASLAEHCGAQVTAVTVQFDDFNPLTVAGSMKAAQELGIAHHILHVKDLEFLSAFEALAGITDKPILDLDLVVVYAALKKYDPRIAGNIFISGMGSDQWFGNEALEKPSGDIETRLHGAHVIVDAHQRVAERFGCQFVFPFLSGPMLALSQEIPAVLKKDKQLLRSLAIAKDIPHRGTKSEIQVPVIMQQVLIKTYGHRAWPHPVTIESSRSSGVTQALEQIILGLRQEKL